MDTISRLLFGCCMLSVVGCPKLPETYNKIEIGKPLDHSALPNQVVVRQESDGVSLWELQQFPFAFKQWNMTIDLDATGKVARVKLEEEACAYWVLAISDDIQAREKSLDPQGRPREKVEPPSSHPMPITDPWFIVGCAGCFGVGAIAYEQELAETPKARASLTTPTARPAAVTK